MSEPPDPPLSRSSHSPTAYRPQFTLRAALLFVTVCCILFAGFAASPGRTLGFVAVAGVLAAAASGLEAERRHVRWLIVGTALGLAAGLALGAALVHSAYGPADKACAWQGFWAFAYAGPLVGGLLALGLANTTRAVAITVAMGAVTPVVGALVLLSLCSPSELDSESATQILGGVGALVAIGVSLALILAADLEHSTTYLFWGLFLLLATLLASCSLFVPNVQR
jgi:hypothetical protein